jgi:hypothetical protein
MASSPNTLLLLWLFAVPAGALLWAIVRTLYRISRGRESGQLRKLEKDEIAAGTAALAALSGSLYG